MIDLKQIRAVAVDIAGANRSHDRQDELAECIWHLLQRHYRLYLFSTEKGEDLSREDFAHPRLTFLREAMPPSQALLEAHPELPTAATLWITDDEQLQRWIGQVGLEFMHLEHNGRTQPGGQHLPHLSELSALLDPTGLLLGDLTTMVDDLRRFRPRGALLVGLGGPPLSGFQQFAIDLRAHLQDAGHPLVDLMDLSSLQRSAEALLEQGDGPHAPWVSESAVRWLHESVVAPLKAGEAVYVESRPPELPADFGAHFPLYVSEESVLLVFSELVFTQELAQAFDLAILLEVSPEETARRLYEIPADERFDPKFTRQYLERDGRIYQDYLRQNRVRERASIRVNANQEGAFYLQEGTGTPLV